MIWTRGRIVTTIILFWTIVVVYFLYSINHMQTETQEPTISVVKKQSIVIRHTPSATTTQRRTSRKPMTIRRKQQTIRHQPSTTTHNELTTTTVPPTTFPVFVTQFCSFIPEEQQVENTFVDDPLPSEMFWITTNGFDRHRPFQLCTNNPKTDTYISKTIHQGSWWEPEIVSVVKKYANGKGRVFVDVGANIGYFSAMAAQSGARVFSFEAVYGNYYRVEATKARMTVATDWTIIWNAVDQFAGRLVSLGTPSKTRNSGNFQIGSGKEPSITTTIDNHVHERVHLMKMDVEGHEAHALAGASTLICYFGVEVIVMEFTRLLTNQKECDWRKMTEWLQRIGYILHDMKGNKMADWRLKYWKPLTNNVMWKLAPDRKVARCTF